MRFFEYIAFIIFDYFYKKDSQLAKTRTIGFLVLLEGTALVPLFILFNLIFRFFEAPDNPNPRMKYFIGIPIVIVGLIINSLLLKNKLTSDNLQKFKSEFPINNNVLVWLIFISPIIFVFVIPIIYGALNGTLRIVGN